VLDFVSVLVAKTLRSSTFRAALISIIGFGALVVGLFVFVYLSTASYILDRADRAIDKDRSVLLAAFAAGGRNELIPAINKQIGLRPDRAIYVLTDAAYAPLAGNRKQWPPALSGQAGRTNFNATETGSALADDRALIRAAFSTLPDGSHLLVGREVTDLTSFVRKIYLALALVIVLIFVLAAGAAVTVTRRTVGRIESVNATSRAIMQSGLGERVPLRGSHDEWDQLAENLNSMLDRISALMEEVKQATDNVAHDLRTPLTRMRGRLENAASRPRDASADHVLITDTMTDLDDVLRMFSALTRISQIESTTRTSGFRSVDLVEISESVADLYDAAAEERKIHLQVIGQKPMLIAGDRDLLFDALANLVDNAIKHGREAGSVVIKLDRCDGAAAVSVADNGPGIPPDEYNQVFRRFYRLERSRCTPGNGLGLSLVAAVARLHEARLELSDNAPGLKVEMRLRAS
jgi:signal transduction histidine kinase